MRGMLEIVGFVSFIDVYFYWVVDMEGLFKVVKMILLWCIIKEYMI